MPNYEFPINPIVTLSKNYTGPLVSYGNRPCISKTYQINFDFFIVKTFKFFHNSDVKNYFVPPAVPIFER